MITLPAPSLFPLASVSGGRGLSLSTPAELDLESQIEQAALRLHTAPNVEARREAWAELTRLHRLRTAETVARLERERGLA